MSWTDGKALVATGSPFSPVAMPGGKTCSSSSPPLPFDIFGLTTPTSRTNLDSFRPNTPDQVAQTNNALIYPALGLGAILSRARTISPSMLMAGVHALASLSPALDDAPEASLLPDLADVREVSVHVAAAVVRQAVEDGNSRDPQTEDVVKGKGPLPLEEYIRVSDILDAGVGAADLVMGELNADEQSRMWDAVYRPLELVD